MGLVPPGQAGGYLGDSPDAPHPPGEDALPRDIAGSTIRIAPHGATLVAIAHRMTCAESFGLAPIPADPVMPVWKGPTNEGSGTRRTPAH